jgi:hypothetical protein
VGKARSQVASTYTVHLCSILAEVKVEVEASCP